MLIAELMRQGIRKRKAVKRVIFKKEYSIRDAMEIINPSLLMNQLQDCANATRERSAGYVNPMFDISAGARAWLKAYREKRESQIAREKREGGK